jgi:integrase
MIKPVDRSDGRRFQVYGKRNGRKVYLGTFASRKEAVAADEDHRAKQRRIAAGELPPDHDDRRTFRQAAALWVAMLRDTSSRSLDGYEGRVENHFLQEFADTPLHEIDRKHVIAWRDSASGKMSGPSVNTLVGTLSSLFAWCVEQRWIERNPCHGVKRLVTAQKVYPWLQSGEQVTRLLAACADVVRDLVAVLVGTGLRIDEALHLAWDDVDMEHRLLTVHRGRKGVTKSGKRRHVPIIDSVYPVLRAMRLARGSNVLLWPGKRTNLPRPQSSMRRPFKRAVLRAGLPKEMRIHDLRHTFASLFLLDGGDIFKLSRILGHSSVAITERTYAHLRPDAFEQDYGRVRFEMPGMGRVLKLAE